AILKIDPTMAEETSEKGLNLTTGHLSVKAGAHRVSAAFVQGHSEIIEDIIAPNEHTLADIDIADNGEKTTYPHLREFEITCPFNVAGISNTATRRRVFTCRPLTPAEEKPCATKIVSNLARQAYRRSLNDEDMEGLMNFYEDGRKDGDFESG